MTSLPKVGGGYQTTDGNRSETKIGVQSDVATATVTATLTTTQLMSGIIVGDQGSSAAAAYTLPTGTLMDSAFTNIQTNGCFDFSVINIGDNASEDITMTAGTGWTVVGDMVVKDAASAGDSSGMFRARKTGTAAWTLYRLA